jgi:hypothetical protein
MVNLPNSLMRSKDEMPLCKHPPADAKSIAVCSGIVTRAQLIRDVGFGSQTGMSPSASMPGMPSSKDEKTCESFDAPFTTAILCMLDPSPLLILTFDPLARTRFDQLMYLASTIYVSYSTLLYVDARWWDPSLPGPVGPWLEVVWARGLIALSSDPNRMLFDFSFFAILIAAFQWGLTPGLHVALVSAALSIRVWAALGVRHPGLILRYVLAALVSLLAVGYMAASFGSHELILKRRLAFLRDIIRSPNPVLESTGRSA